MSHETREERKKTIFKRMTRLAPEGRVTVHQLVRPQDVKVALPSKEKTKAKVSLKEDTDRTKPLF